MKQIWRYLLILVVVLVTWNTIFIKPLKLFTVFLHELGHSLMAVIFGNGISGIKINFNESGYALVHTKGWLSQFMVTSGGYLGSLFFAILILYLKRTAIKKYLLGTIAIIFLIVSVKFAGLDSTLVFSIIFAGIVIAIYMIQSEKVNDWAIDILGISSVAYSIHDTFVDTILLKFRLPLSVIGEKSYVSDSERLAQITFIPSVVWGILWFVISIVAVYFLLIKTGSSKASASTKNQK